MGKTDRHVKYHMKKGSRDPEALERVIYSHYKLQPVYRTQKVFLLNTLISGTYESSVCIGNKEYVSNDARFQKIKDARKCALNKAVNDLQASKWPADVPKLEVTETFTDNFSIDTWTKTLNNETIALLFKDILRHLAGRNRIMDGKYKTCAHHEGNFIGYISEVHFNGEIFKSLGLMTSEDQAEQSAAEICLRTLGFLPEVDNEDALIIQPYQGGIFDKDLGVNYSKKPYIFTSKLSSDILKAFVASWNLMHLPKYYVKYVDSKSKNDNGEKVVDCICCVDGKFFEASGPQPESLAIQLAADNAVKYFGITNLYERMEFRKHLYLHRYDWYRQAELLTTGPSEKKCWLWTCYARENSYKECEMSQTVQELVESSIFQSGLLTVDYQNRMIEAEVKRAPSFQGRLVSELDDLCVADIDATNPNLVTIGNSDFSIKMWCTSGKIYSKQRQCSVDILPGHNIKQLNCEYRALPSLETYLHAVDCNDLSYPNPPKPVVTSCCVVVLSHDYSAGSNNIYVLLKRKVDYKEVNSSSVTSLKNLLNKLIQPNLETDVTVEQAMEGIEQWSEHDVRLLSEMSMDSLYRLMSMYVDYDSRWNELFTNSDLPEELKEIQDICMNELKRLEEERLSKYADREWELPQTEFLSRFGDTGIHIEGSVYCGMRSLAEMTNTKISLRDIEKCSVIDLPVGDDVKKHSGVSRFYIWNRTEKAFLPETDDSVSELPDGYTLLEKNTIQHNSIRYHYPNLPKRQYYVQYINLDGTKVSVLPTNKRTIHLPGDVGFSCFKNSLWYAAINAHINPPCITRYNEHVTWGRRCAALKLQRNTEERKFIFRSKANNYVAAEELVCKKALEALGYKMQSENKNEDSEEGLVVEVTVFEANEDDDFDNDSHIGGDGGVSGDPDINDHMQDDDVSVNGVIDDNVEGQKVEVKEERIAGKVKANEDDDFDNDSHVEGDGGVGGDPGINDHMQDDDVSGNGVIDDNAEGQKGDVKEEMIAGKVKGYTRKARSRQTRPFDSSHLPRRDAFRLQCGWILLDEATGKCPVFKKLTETTQFQKQLDLFTSQMGNNTWCVQGSLMDY